MKLLDNGPEKQKLIDEMVEIVRRRRTWTFGLLPHVRRRLPAWVHNGKPTHMVRDQGALSTGIDPDLARAEARRMEPAGLVAVLPLIALGVAAGGLRRARRRSPAAACERETAARARWRAEGAVLTMFDYILRRLCYGVLILIGVNLFTFVLFFTVNTPDDMARLNIGGKRVTPEQIEKWKVERGYDKPLLLERRRRGQRASSPTRSSGSVGVAVRLRIRPRRSESAARHRPRDANAHVGRACSSRCRCSCCRLIVSIAFSLLLVFFRHTRIDFWGVVLCVVMMSISRLFYIIVGQYFFASCCAWCRSRAMPAGWMRIKFLVLPVMCRLVARLAARRGCTARFFSRRSARTTCAPRAPRACRRRSVLFRHVLQNAMIPILTGVVVVMPLLFIGSLIMEIASSAFPAWAATRSTPSARRTSPSCARWCSSARCSTSSASS